MKLKKRKTNSLCVAKMFIPTHKSNASNFVSHNSSSQGGIGNNNMETFIPPLGEADKFGFYFIVVLAAITLLLMGWWMYQRWGKSIIP